ncbi:hypothetical protein NC653_023628 [Populus alba x Populus x berolinensis]|uniref:Uncharacterized protein n=1 Tax=Populus alba x Populus x berolinensis TaxID=444605 RepID=A0AAD6MIA8_9ROSI|nr:hypothetical protein NC653_023628 [Populus alba x Populus x berolinensis]
MADNNSTSDCVGTVLPRMDAGHFSREDPLLMHLQGTPDKSINITIASASLQSFTEQQWRTNQQDITNTARTVCLHYDRSNLKRFPIWISNSKYHSWKFTLPELVCLEIQCSSL